MEREGRKETRKLGTKLQQQGRIIYEGGENSGYKYDYHTTHTHTHTPTHTLRTHPSPNLFHFPHPSTPLA
jgi:hypothetical protein